MQFEEVGEGDRQLGIVLEFDLHLDLELSPSLFAHFKRVLGDH